MAGTAPGKTGATVSTPRPLPPPASLLCTTTPFTPTVQPRPITQQVAHPVPSCPVFAAWSPTDLGASHQASGVASSEKLSMKPLVGVGMPSLPSPCCHLPALSLPGLAPKLEQGLIRGFSVSCGCAGLLDRGHWERPPCQARLSWYHHPPTTLPRGYGCGPHFTEVQTGWGRRRDWSKFTVERVRVTMLTATACPPLTNAHHADVSPQDLAALQHDLLQLQKAGVSSSRAQGKGQKAAGGGEGPTFPSWARSSDTSVCM